jgi:hypothetical protein
MFLFRLSAFFLCFVLAFSWSLKSMQKKTYYGSYFKYIHKRDRTFEEMIEELKESPSEMSCYSCEELRLLLESDKAKKMPSHNKSLNIDWILPEWVLHYLIESPLELDKVSLAEGIFNYGDEAKLKLLCKHILLDNHEFNNRRCIELIEKRSSYRCAEHFINTTKEYFPLINAEKLCALLKTYSSLAKELLPLAQQHIATVSNKTVKKLIECLPQERNNLFQSMLATLTTDSPRTDLIPVFLEQNPSLGLQCIPYLKEQWCSLPHYSISGILRYSNNTDLKKSIIDIVGEHIDKSTFDNKIFHEIVEEEALKPYLDPLIPRIAKNIETIAPLKIAYLLDRYYPGTQGLQALQSALQPYEQLRESTETVSDILKEDPLHSLYTVASYLHNPSSLHVSSQTEGYLAHKRARFRLKYGKNGYQDLNNLAHGTKIIALLNEMHKHEQELIKQDFYILVTGQPARYHFLIDCYTELWQLQHGKKLDGQLLVPIAGDEPVRDMFLNCSIFNNFINHAECSLHFFLLNLCEYGRVVGLGDLLEACKLEEYYGRYYEEFKKLEELHKEALCGYGNLLQIALRKEVLQTYVRPALFGGYDTKVTIDTTPTDDPAVILSTLATEPHRIKYGMEGIIFCLNPRQFAQVQPHPNIKVYSFNIKDQAKWQEYVEQRDALLAHLLQESLELRP